jgi:nitrite reductase/ring-hydroxylating ferredoxin subunit
MEQNQERSLANKELYYHSSISASELRGETIYAKNLDGELEVIAIATDANITNIKVIEDICPHMGAPLSEGRYCRKTNTLQCPWHGYIFSLETGVFVENPNELIWEKLRYPTECFTPNKTPKYKLILLPYKLKGDEIYVCRTV